MPERDPAMRNGKPKSAQRRPQLKGQPWMNGLAVPSRATNGDDGSGEQIVMAARAY